MTASTAPDTMDVAPQSMREQHTVAVDNIQKRELQSFLRLVFFFAILGIVVLIPLILHQVVQFGRGLPPGLPHQGQ